MTEFGTAAYTLFDVCVKHYGYGGVAEHVGECRDSSEQRQQDNGSHPALHPFNNAEVLKWHSQAETITSKSC